MHARYIQGYWSGHTCPSYFSVVHYAAETRRHSFPLVPIQYFYLYLTFHDELEYWCLGADSFKRACFRFKNQHRFLTLHLLNQQFNSAIRFHSTLSSCAIFIHRYSRCYCSHARLSVTSGSNKAETGCGVIKNEIAKLSRKRVNFQFRRFDASVHSLHNIFSGFRPGVWRNIYAREMRTFSYALVVIK